MNTTVEFLQIVMPKLFYISKSNKVKFDELMEQAKKMEKEQIVSAWNDGLWGKLREGEDNAESYYNETFKSE
jgi:hypothetical protein